MQKLKKICQKIKSIIIVERDILKNKWWHRLANVLIYGSAIILAIFLLLIIPFSDYSTWQNYKYTYSFEPNYNTADGTETNCDFYDHEYTAPGIYCGDISNSTDFLIRYRKARSNYKSSIQNQPTTGFQPSDFQPINTPSQPQASKGKTYEELLREGAVPVKQPPIDFQPLPNRPPLSSFILDSKLQADDEIVNNGIKNGEFVNIKVKKATTVVYSALIWELFLVATLVLAWLIFWESIIYRTFVYIIYGSNK